MAEASPVASWGLISEVMELSKLPQMPGCRLLLRRIRRRGRRGRRCRGCPRRGGELRFGLGRRTAGTPRATAGRPCVLAGRWRGWDRIVVGCARERRIIRLLRHLKTELRSCWQVFVQGYCEMQFSVA